MPHSTPSYNATPQHNTTAPHCHPAAHCSVQLACSFKCVDKVLSVAMSSCAASHALIAVGDKQQGLVLADIASGAFTHTLDGHRWASLLPCQRGYCQLVFDLGDAGYTQQACACICSHSYVLQI